jgi:uncharacterized BrkB/YihY/UPF0761 family membrane protein
VVGVSRVTARARLLRSHMEAGRVDHASLDFGFGLVERDAAIGGALLAGALAYRLFVLIVPTSLLLVSGLGLYAGAVDKAPSAIVSEAGLHGLVGAEVAATAAGHQRAVVFVLMLPAVVYATVTLYRAIVKVHALAWFGSAHGVRVERRGLVVFASGLAVQVAVVELVGWIRRGDRYGGLAVLAVYLVVVGGTWLAISLDLPHAPVRWFHLLPGALVVGVGLLVVNVFNVYVTTRLVENRANTYGALGIATALLFSLVLVGRLMVVSAELNASLSERRARKGSPG